MNGNNKTTTRRGFLGAAMAMVASPAAASTVCKASEAVSSNPRLNELKPGLKRAISGYLSTWGAVNANYTWDGLNELSESIKSMLHPLEVEGIIHYTGVTVYMPESEKVRLQIMLKHTPDVHSKYTLWEVDITNPNGRMVCNG